MKKRNEYFKDNSVVPFKLILAAKRDIEKKFECYSCSIIGGILVCKGNIQPSTESDIYKIRIKYNGKNVPTVHILSPEVPYDIKAHMYSDKSLCLYFPKEQPWSNKMKISETIIPWASEWIVYYELYRYCGTWLGPEADHRNSEKIKE